jgi:type IV secretory pathway TraG/TraD family ATPase VirD4
MREGFSYGANDMRDGVTLNQERRKSSVIMSSEFSKLNDLEAYLKLPGNFPITKLKFKYQEKPDIAEPLVARDIQDMLIARHSERDANQEKSIPELKKNKIKKPQKTNSKVKKLETIHENIDVKIDNNSIDDSFNF